MLLQCKSITFATVSLFYRENIVIWYNNTGIISLECIAEVQFLK